jgi:hypothetical protein
MSERPFRMRFEVSNPSDYHRSDYVEVNLTDLKVPEKEFVLYRINGENNRVQIPYQVDSICGGEEDVRILSFYAENIPASGCDDYSKSSATFELSEGNPMNIEKDNSLWTGYYHQYSKNDEPADGFNYQWDQERDLNGVKLGNGFLELYFSLVPQVDSSIQYSFDVAGSVTSIKFPVWPGGCNILEPFSPYYESPMKRWGQVKELIFFPFPWEPLDIHRVSMAGKKYELIYSNCGPIRTLATFKSEPIKINFNSGPYLKKRTVEIDASLYRVIWLYPNNPYYMEEIFVLTEDDKKHSIGFRPYIQSYFHYPPHLHHTNLIRYEHVPDYFALWKSFSKEVWTYGFASDAHVRGIEIKGNEIHWRLSSTHRKKCIHYFSYNGAATSSDNTNLAHMIGHFGWYENILKPIETTPLYRRFPEPISQ